MDHAIDAASLARAPARRWRLSQQAIVLLLTVLLMGAFAALLPGFGSLSNLVNLMRSIAVLGILGLGMGLVVITRGLDLSQIAIMAASWSVALFQLQAGWPVAAAVALSVVIALGLGLLNGVLVAFVEAPALFATLASGLVIYGIGFWLAPAWVVYAPTDGPALLFFGQGQWLGLPMPLIVFAIAALAAHGLLAATSIGRFFYAQGDNPQTARLTGIALRPMTLLAHVLVALSAWLAGLVWIGTTGSMQMGVTQGAMVFDVILVVVLGGISLAGGRGGVSGVVAGCMLIGTLLNAFTILDVKGDVQNIIRGAVLLAAILIDNHLHPRNEETARQGD